MKRLLTVAGAILFLGILSWLLMSLGIADTPVKTADLKSASLPGVEELCQGKWVDHSDGYYVKEGAKSTVKRYKMYTFESDGDVTLDSAKQKYIGTWEVRNDTINIVFLSHVKSLELSPKKLTFTSGGRLTSGEDSFKHMNSAIAGLLVFVEFSGFANATLQHLIMLLVGLIFMFIGIKYNYEPLLLVPIGTGVLIGNIPFFQAEGFNLILGVYEEGSVLNYLYFGVANGIYPPLIFLGIGAMTDFSSLISNPKLVLLGAAAQLGIFATFLGALYLGFNPQEAGAIGIIGGADGPTAIFTASKLANGIKIIDYTATGEPIRVLNLIGPIAIAAYSYMALVPVIQPPIMRLLTTRKERLIRMRPPRSVSRIEKLLFPIIGLLLTTYLAPSALPLLGMLFFGNILKESGVTERLAETARTSMIDIVTIILGMTVGASTQADVFLTKQSVLIFILGALSFMIATAGGVIFAKFMNLFLRKENKINPLVGASGVSAVPDSARVVQMEGLREDRTNHLLMHAMAPNVAGVIGSAVAAGILLAFLL